jgi:hypothetical protein
MAVPVASHGATGLLTKDTIMHITDLTTDTLNELLEENDICPIAFDAFVEDIAGTHYDYGGTDPQVIADTFLAAFAGAGNLPDYAYDYARECLGLEGTALDYFDADKFARDLELGGDMHEVRGYLFHGSW